jgi:hypothetical protein
MKRNNDDGLPAVHPKKLRNSQLSRVTNVETIQHNPRTTNNLQLPTNLVVPPFDLNLKIGHNNSQDDVSECTQSTSEHSKAILSPLPNKDNIGSIQHNLMLNNIDPQNQQQLQPQQQTNLSPSPRKNVGSNSPRRYVIQNNQVVQRQHLITSPNEVVNTNQSTMMNNIDNVFNNCFITETTLNTNAQSPCPNGEYKNDKNGKLGV